VLRCRELARWMMDGRGEVRLDAITKYLESIQQK
jgi:hypothetical protein